MESSKFKVQSSNPATNSKTRVFDLEERLAVFGENVIKFCRTLVQDVITRPLISQLIRSATSIGANYAEANNASSKKDFRNKVYISKKEAQETKHWLRMLKTATNESVESIEKLELENHQLILILQSITNKIDQENGA